MGWFRSNHDEELERRKDCRNCDGLGRVLETETVRIVTKNRRTKEREVDYVQETNWVRCGACKGHGYK